MMFASSPRPVYPVPARSSCLLSRLAAFLWSSSSPDCADLDLPNLMIVVGQELKIHPQSLSVSKFGLENGDEIYAMMMMDGDD
ncbi:hypothetical protein ACOSQ2_020451 [Xanthoceras sorbifolium]